MPRIGSLMIVDLKRRRRLATRVSKQLLKVKVVECAAQCWNTLPIPCKHDQATYQMRYVFACALDGTRATFSGLSGQRITPSDVLMHGKVIGVQLDRCSFMAPVRIEQFFDAFSLAQNDSGGQPHARRWVSRQATLQRILISTIRREANSRSPQDAYLLSDGQLQRKAGLM